MNGEVEYIIQFQSNSQVKALDNFLTTGKYQTPSGCRYTNIFNQKTGACYYIPFSREGKVALPSFARKEAGLEERTVLEEHLASSLSLSEFETPIEEFFALLEECRLHGSVLGFTEKQYLTVPVKKKTPPVSETQEEQEPSFSELEPEDLKVNHSCIELDFDIYQSQSTRGITEIHYVNLINAISAIFKEQLDFEGMSESQGVIERNGAFSSVHFHVAVLRKPELQEVTHKTYGRCWKEGFHMRIFIKVDKSYKKFLIETITERVLASGLFQGLGVLNPVTELLDRQSASFGAMLLGSAKKKSNQPQEFHLLYRVNLGLHAGAIANINISREFDPRPLPPSETPSKRTRKPVKPPPRRYNFNLCFELSLNYEVPGGLIKKRIVLPRQEIQGLIQSRVERLRHRLISPEELEETKNYVTDLTVRDYQAKYIYHILELLKTVRISEYKSWFSIVVMLARENPDYKPLAIWVSQRCPQSWANNGAAHLDQIWDWALNQEEGISPYLGFPSGGEEVQETRSRTIRTLYSWAKEDSPEKYQQLQEFNSYTKLQKLILANCGLLNESHFAEILKIMYGDIFKVDEDIYAAGRGRNRRWFQFVFPKDAGRYDDGLSYKWRLEKWPDDLHLYISEKLPQRLDVINDYISKQSEGVADEEQLKYFGILKKNLVRTKYSLGKDTMIKNIISICEVKFRVGNRGFVEKLDKDGDVIGTSDGVLRLYPRTESIRRYHEIPISRSTRVIYNPAKIDHTDPAWSTEHPDPHIRRLMVEIRRLFAEDEDAFLFVMCYLASSLDGRKKKPLFFIWLGEGANGKSFLLELHIKTLNSVVRGGYAAKMNSSYFTKEIKNTGPDSEKMMLKHCRFAYCSESEPGDALRMSRIKEFTSETLSGNEKFQTQDMFEANCNFTFCSNFDPRVSGRDYGTWRRILAYWFKMKFTDKPDPSNPHEWKDDSSLINEVPNDPRYRQAYLSILVYFYEILRDRYGGKLDLVPKPSIDRETQIYKDTQDTIEQFITERVVFIGEFYPGGKERVPEVAMDALVEKYIKWHLSRVDKTPGQNKDLAREFPKTRLKRFFVQKMNKVLYLTKHKVLDSSEVYSPPSEPTPPAPINEEPSLEPQEPPSEEPSLEPQEPPLEERTELQEPPLEEQEEIIYVDDF